MSSDIKKLLRELQRDGWQLTHSKHIKLFKPGLGTVIVSSSPSCKFAASHVEQDIRRLKRRAGIKV